MRPLRNVLLALTCVLAIGWCRDALSATPMPDYTAARRATDPADAPPNPLSMKRWSPHVVGAAIGVLSCLALLLLGSPLGCSTAFSRSAGMIERLVRGSKVDRRPYYQTTVPKIDWQWMLVLGIAVGALASALWSGEFHVSWVPAKWGARFGDAPVVRWLVALAGGVCMGFGARWAGGCTSGHGISGVMQMALSGWVSAACFFAGGIATAMILYG